MVTLQHYLVLSALLFSIGLTGLILRRNILIIFMSIEILLNAVNLTLIGFSRFRQDLDGQILALFVIAVAAAEAAVGLAIVISLFRNRSSVQTDDWKAMKN